MDLPKKLLDQYPTVRENNTVPMYRQYPALLIFDNGGTERVSITAKNKSYWTGQLEKRDYARVEQSTVARSQDCQGEAV